MAKPPEIEPSAPRQASGANSAQGDAANDETAWDGRRGGTKPDALLGTTLHEAYAVERLVGEGGMGRVYEARHTRIPQKRYAIKVLRPEFAAHPDAVARFQREAETAASVTHPNVVGVYDVDRTPDGLPYLVCEYLEGLELGSHVDIVGKLQAVTAVHICVEVCKALEAAHASGVIHRDLKPQNVFLVGKFEDGVPLRPGVKVLDFGLSRFQDSGGNTLTRTGVVMGTPSFMAPEQARGQKTDHRTDIYGVGAILYNLLTGRAPFGEDTAHLTVLAVMDHDPPRPRSIDPSISQHLELVVQRAMAKDPAERYPDILALRHALEPFADPAGDMHLAPAGATTAARQSTDNEAAEAETARPRLLVTMVLAAAFLTALLAMALVSVGVLTGWLTFRPVELALLLVAAIGTALTPGIILIRRIRRVVWNNTARVLDTLERVSAPLLAGLLGYGAANLVVRFGDMVVARFTDARLFGHPSGIAWPGWDLVFPVVGAITAGAVWLRQAVLTERRGRLQQFLRGPVLYTAGLLAAATTVYGGLAWRAARHAPPLIAAATSSASASPPTQPPPDTVKHVTPASSETAPLRAGSDELAKAVALGIDGLAPLAEKYPGDPDVLKPLVLAYAARATGHVDAMVTAKRLFHVAPERVDDPELRLVVSQIARSSKSASDQALTLMAENMGSAGTDLLYDIAISRSPVAERAEKMLAQPDVQAHFSPALSVAYELRQAKSCADKLPLLERASNSGDARSIFILDPLTKGAKRGCGKWRNQPCPAPCAREAAQYRDAVTKISARIRKTP